MPGEKFMKKISFLLTVGLILSVSFASELAANPSIERYYSSKAERLKAPDEIKAKCFQNYSLTIFVVSNGIHYSNFGKSLEARPYNFDGTSQKECYIKKNYNNISEILIIHECDAAKLFCDFAEISFIKNFEIYFVSAESKNCVTVMEKMKPFIEKNVRPKYEFVKIGMIECDMSNFGIEFKNDVKHDFNDKKNLSKEGSTPKKIFCNSGFGSKHKCKISSPLRQMTTFSVETLN